MRHVRPVVVPQLPSPYQVGGPILEEVALSGSGEEREAIKAHMAKGALPGLVIDAFENTSRKHIMGLILALLDTWSCFDARETGTRHDGIAIGIFVEGVIKELEEAGFPISSFCSDSDGGIARMRRILAKRWPKMIFSPCFAHLINCMVGAILKHPRFKTIMDMVNGFVNKANHCTARWLPVIMQFIRDVYGLVLALLKMVGSRWNSAHQAAASMLRVQSALRMFVLAHHGAADFPSAFLVAGQDDFWHGVIELECVLRPMVRASLLLQRQEMTYAEVTVCFFNMYKTFMTYSKT